MQIFICLTDPQFGGEANTLQFSGGALRDFIQDQHPRGTKVRERDLAKSRRSFSDASLRPGERWQRHLFPSFS